jgi:hypothetical protein
MIRAGGTRDDLETTRTRFSSRTGDLSQSPDIGEGDVHERQSAQPFKVPKADLSIVEHTGVSQ